jgi:hypothetical protein
MSKETKTEVLVRLRRRHAMAGARHKSQRPDQAVELLGYHRAANPFRMVSSTLAVDAPVLSAKPAAAPLASAVAAEVRS